MCKFVHHVNKESALVVVFVMVVLRVVVTMLPLMISARHVVRVVITSGRAQLVNK